MKKVTMLCMLLITTACTQQQPKTKAQAKKTTGIQYTCTMHPDVLSSKPGTCPKCGMQLVEKDDSK